ncbi:chromosome segregation and condensation protein ScpA [Ruminiclostridium papyrosolvens DSM 2782]|uniref:Segregation and condensation protein A n=1 Tax=Ruminiclostridium papyrosolvens DSM 2782 TaxID=588581 RepID=F1T9Y7_9FIRM|nr:segregation/condensation protein A [Ruminiclostridium papyrosolvens]EGD48729.1 chromosome segregation and condensation protein ScpA [Ruminiclostridium papyrosolvens DSM 2782]WES32515.1 segregation/condensation protein A [Ruminiclostridium papyrosolvens DSM 2782]
MESSLTNACTLKLDNFEGPFDLLFHLFEKNQVDIYDIPISSITDQYLDYLYAMQQLDLEVASEFLIMAATLLHIKSKTLLPSKKEEKQEEIDPREELVRRLVEYKRYKEFTQDLKEMEKKWDRVSFRLPEALDLPVREEIMEIDPQVLRQQYIAILDRNKKKINLGAKNITKLVEHEKVSLRSKMREVVKQLIHKVSFKFSELFSLKTKSKTEVVTGFMAILELAKMRKVKIVQNKQFSDIHVIGNTENEKEDYELYDDIDENISEF